KPSEIDIRVLPLDDAIARAASPSAGAREEDELGQALRQFLAGIDAAEIARGLGEKARAARSKRAPLSYEPPLTASGQARPTRTFAARPDVAKWISSSAPPTPPARPA